jgi:L-fucose mutarotase
MLKGISPLLCPELLKILAEMGHGDDLALVDANFPAAALAKRLVRSDGVPVTALLEAVLRVFPLDLIEPDPARCMAIVGEGDRRAAVVTEFDELLTRALGRSITCWPLDRDNFYHASERAFAVVMSGERRLYGNILIRKGVVGPD